MIVYHGTCSKFGEKIVAQKCFSASAPSNYVGDVKNGDHVINVETSKGYVFFTNDFSIALHYGSITCLSEHDNSIHIFRVNIPDELLTPDVDLERFGDIQNTKILSLCFCGDVELKKYICDLVSVPSFLDKTNKRFYSDVIKALLIFANCEMTGGLNDFQSKGKEEALETLFQNKKWIQITTKETEIS